GSKPDAIAEDAHGLAERADREPDVERRRRADRSRVTNEHDVRALLRGARVGFVLEAREPGLSVEHVGGRDPRLRAGDRRPAARGDVERALYDHGCDVPAVAIEAGHDRRGERRAVSYLEHWTLRPAERRRYTKRTCPAQTVLHPSTRTVE